MSATITITLQNDGAADLRVTVQSAWTENWSGKLSGLLPAGKSATASCDKDSWLKGGGVFGHARIDLEFYLAGPVTVQNGPVSQTFPPVPVAIARFDDATWQDWTGGGYALAMASPYPQYTLTFSLTNGVAKIVLVA